MESKVTLKEGMMPAVIRGFLIALCSGSLGYGISQQTLGREMTEKLGDINVVVTRTVKDVEHLQIRVSHNEADVKALMEQTDRRVFQLAETMRTAISQTSELIALIKVQNELLRAKEPQRTN